MSTTIPVGWPNRLRSAAWWRNYAAMVVSMFAGMAVGHAVNHMLFHDLGEVSELAVMAGWMTAGMLAWMVFRRHSLRAVAQMVLAMNVPFAIACVLLAADAVEYEVASTVGHVGMLAGMAVAMLVFDPCERRPAG